LAFWSVSLCCTIRASCFIKCERYYLVCDAREKGILVLRFSSALVSQRDHLVPSGSRSQTEILSDNVIEEWKALWRDRCDDKIRAEAMASRDFSLLCIEKGTVIAASRAFKPLDLRSILKSHEADDVNRVVSPHPSVGGWRKFARTALAKQGRVRTGKHCPRCRSRRDNRQMRKGGRGWLHRRPSE
jgi:hypothetical protein